MRPAGGRLRVLLLLPALLAAFCLLARADIEKHGKKYTRCNEVDGAVYCTTIDTSECDKTFSLTIADQHFCFNNGAPIGKRLEEVYKIMRGFNPANDWLSLAKAWTMSHGMVAQEIYRDEGNYWKLALGHIPAALRTGWLESHMTAGKGCSTLNRQNTPYCAELALSSLQRVLEPALNSEKGCASIKSAEESKLCVEAVRERCGTKPVAGCTGELAKELQLADKLFKGTFAQEVLLFELFGECTVEKGTNYIDPALCQKEYDAALKRSEPLAEPGSVSYVSAAEPPKSKKPATPPHVAQKPKEEPKPVAQNKPEPRPTPTPAPTPVAHRAGLPGDESKTEVGPSGARPSLRGASDDDDDSVLAFRCALSFNSQSMVYGADANCRNLSNADLVHFEPEIDYLLSHASIDSYFELLRMEAITRFLETNAELTGTEIDPSMLKDGCKPFAEGIKRFNAFHRLKKGKPRLQDHEYLLKMQENAERADALGRQLNNAGYVDYYLDHCPDYGRHLAFCADPHESNGVACRDVKNETFATTPEEMLSYEKHNDHAHACGVSPELREQYHQYVTDLTERYYKTLQAYPALLGGLNPKEKPWVSVPTPLNRFATNRSFADDPEKSLWANADLAAKQLTKDMVNAANRFCGDTPMESDWRLLISLPNITSPVLRNFPVFQHLQQCATQVSEDKSRMLSIAKTVQGIGCFVGMLGPQAVAVGPICTVAFVGQSLLEARYAGKDLDFKKSCIVANAGNPQNQKLVCETKDYLQAVARYDEALHDLKLNIVFAAVEGASAAVHGVQAVRAARALGKLREAEAFLTADELEKLSTYFKSNPSAKDLERAQAELDKLVQNRKTGSVATTSVDKAIQRGGGIHLSQEPGVSDTGVFDEGEVGQPAVSDAERQHYREVFNESSENHVGVPDLASRGNDVGKGGVILTKKVGGTVKSGAIPATDISKVVKLERIPGSVGGEAVKGVKIRLTRANGEVVEGFSRDLEIPVALKDPKAKVEVELVLDDGKTVAFDPGHLPEGQRIALNKAEVLKKGLPGCHTMDCWDYYRKHYPDLTKQIREREVTFTLKNGKRVDMQVVDYGTLEKGGSVRQAKQPKTMFRSQDDLKAFEDEIVSQGAEQLKNAPAGERKVSMKIKVTADSGKEVELTLTAWVERGANGEIKSVETWYVEGESFNNPEINIGERNWDRDLAPAKPKGESPANVARYSKDLEGLTEAERAKAVHGIEALEKEGFSEQEIRKVLDSAKGECHI